MILGIGDIEPYGQSIIKTPNLQTLADEGMTFSNFYAGSTVCAPSRASLLTGQHTGHTKVRGNGEFPLDENKKIFPELLKDAGYQNAIFGKWGMGLANSSSTPNQRGFDKFAGHLHHMQAHFQTPDSLDVFKNGQLTRMNLPKGTFANDYFVDETINFIKENVGKNPFFVWLSLTVPHAELVVPKRYFDQQLNQNNGSIHPNEKAFKGGHYGAQPYPKAAYAALVNSIDDYVGEIMKTVANLGIDDNTIIIFTSDNGTHTEGGRTLQDVDYFKSSGIHKGVKRDLFEGGIREPFIVRWKNTVKPKSTSNFQGAFWDIYPTFVEISNIKVNNNDPIDGISFVNALKGKKQKKHDFLYWEFHEFGGKQAVLKGKWKAVRLDVNKNPSNKILLFNVKKDPEELYDLSDKNPRKTKKMNHLLDNIRTENPNFNFEK